MTDIRLVTVSPEPFAAVRRRTTFAEVPRVLLAGLDEVWKVIRERGMTPGHNVAVYRHVGEGSVDLTCGVQVATSFADVGEVFSAETPGGAAVTATHVGPYVKLRDTYDELATWAQANGRRLAKVNWEVYGDGSEDPAKAETQVFMLLELENVG